MLAKRRRLETPPGTPSSSKDNEDLNEHKLSLLSLPNEILFKILEDLSHRQRNQVALVCMRLYMICRNPKLLSRKAINFQKLENASIDFICGHLPTKTLELSLDGGDLFMDKRLEKAVKETPENFQYIETLEIFYGFVRDRLVLKSILGLFANVTKIVWASFDTEELPDVKDLQRVMKNVSTMKFNCSVPPKAFNRLTTAAVNLTRLELDSFDTFDETSLERPQPYTIYVDKLELFSNRKEFKKLVKNNIKLDVTKIRLDIENIQTFPTRDEVVNLTKCLTGTISLEIYGIDHFENLHNHHDFRCLYPLFPRVKELILRCKLATVQHFIGFPQDTLSLLFEFYLFGHEDWHNLECIDVDFIIHYVALDNYLIRFKKYSSKLRRLTLNIYGFNAFFGKKSKTFINFDEIFVNKICWPISRYKQIKKITCNPKIFIVNQLDVNCDDLQKSDDVLNLYIQFSEAVAKVKILIIEKSSNMKPELLTALENMTRYCPVEKLITDSWRDEFQRIKSLTYILDITQKL